MKQKLLKLGVITIVVTLLSVGRCCIMQSSLVPVACLLGALLCIGWVMVSVDVFLSSELMDELRKSSLKMRIGTLLLSFVFPQGWLCWGLTLLPLYFGGKLFLMAIGV